MKKLKNGLPDFPENWGEISFADSLKLLDRPTKAESIRRILGIPPGAKVEGMEALYRAAGFLDKPVPLEENPKTLGAYQLPQAVELETAEQFEDITVEIQKAWDSKDLLIQTEALPLYAAIYLQPHWFGNSYDKEQAILLAGILKTYPCTEVMSAGAFFQARYLSTASGLSMTYLRQSQLQKKPRRVSRNFTKHLARMLRWITLPATLAKTMKNS